MSPPARNPPPPRPEWVSFLNDSQWRRFLELIEARFQKQGRPFRIDESGVVHVDHGAEEPQRFGLQNVAQLCHLHPPDDWPDIIDHHFGMQAQAMDQMAEVESQMADFAKVRDRIMVRLWPEDYVGPGGPQLVCRRDIPGTISALAIDLPSAVATLTPDQARGWGLPPEELFALGLDNVRRTCKPQRQEFDVAEGITLQALIGDSFFTATHALLPELHPQCLGPYGTLLGIPHRHTIIAYPIRDAGVFTALQRMFPMTRGMYEEGPGSISPDVYWLHESRYTLLPVRPDGQQLRFDVPDAFARMLQDLGEDQPR